jgi:hypothetical protein
MASSLDKRTQWSKRSSWLLRSKRGDELELCREASGRRALATARSSRLHPHPQSICRSCSVVDGEPAVRHTVRRSKHRLVIVAPSGPCVHTLPKFWGHSMNAKTDTRRLGDPQSRCTDHATSQRRHCRAKVLRTEYLGAK